jgi:predicted negative regulator of RcsB-dependent stress response
VAIFAVRFFLNKQEEQRQQALSQIDLAWNDEENAVNKQKQKFEEELGNLTKSMEKVDPNAPEKARLDAQMKEIEAKVAALEPNDDASYVQYRAFYEKYPNYPEGWVAGLKYCSQLVKKRDFKASEPILEAIQSKSKDKLMLQILAQNMLINVLQELKEYDRALKVTDQMLPSAPANLKAKILLEKGSIQLAIGQKDAASKTFEQVVKDHEGTQEASYARAYKALLR